MRLVPLALLAALPLASPAAALGVVVESGPIAPGETVVVSWTLPSGFEESELLIALEGGPRARLTDESPEARPRFLVRLPAVVGTARFVVRAGRTDASGRHRTRPSGGSPGGPSPERRSPSGTETGRPRPGLRGPALARSRTLPCRPGPRAPPRSCDPERSASCLDPAGEPASDAPSPAHRSPRCSRSSSFQPFRSTRRGIASSTRKGRPCRARASRSSAAPAPSRPTRRASWRSSPSRLAESIESLAGVSKSDESTSAVPVVRGLSRGRTLILLDDGRVSAERRAGASASYLDPLALEAVEVVRGPGSVAYGSDALGGIVHARTPMPEPHALGFRYRFTAGAGGSPEATAGIGANVPVGRGAFSPNLCQRSQGDYESPLGKQDNSAVRDRGFVVRGLVPVRKARLRVGVDVNGRTGLEALNIVESFDEAGTPTGRTTEVAVEDASRTDLGAFVEGDLPLAGDRLTLTAGLRGDRVTTENTGGWYGDRSTSDGALSGFATLSVSLAREWNLSAQYSRGFRDPTLSDRYFRGDSGRGFVVGNPDLAAETSNQWDLSLRGRAGLVSLGLSGYLYRIEDLVERYRDGSDYRFRNRGEAEITGVELEADVRVAPRLVVRLTGSLSRGKVLDDGTWAPDILPPTAQVIVDHEPFGGLFWRARFVAMGRDERPGASEVVVAGYGRLDLSAGWRFSDRLTVAVSARNLFDKEYADSADENDVVAPGRGAILTLSGSF